MDSLASATTSGIVTGSSSVGGGGGGGNNPFERLRPLPRSEEDEIRKGIFGQALRLLFSASDDDKVRWRRVIEEAVAARQSTSRRNQRKHQPQLKREAGEIDDAMQQLETTTTVKRVRLEDGVNDDESGRMEVRGKMQRPLAFQQQQQLQLQKEGEESGIKASSSSHVSGDCLSAADAGSPSPSDVEFIAAYLRTLLDKVVGLSLLELHVDALRVLCVMLSIPLPNSKSKMVHYSTLASFHYTHCEKLGKRVPRSYYMDEQDEHMMQKTHSSDSAAHASATRGRRAKTKPLSSTAVMARATTTTTTRAAAAEATEKLPKRPKSSRRSVLRAVDNNVSSPVNAPSERQPKSAIHGAALARMQGLESEEAEEDEEDAMLGQPEPEVQLNGRVFANVADRHQQQQFSSAHRHGDDDNNNNNNLSEEEEESEWSMAQLEKKVASVVHLYDPVTSAVVVKKLAQMGYRSPSALQTVEMILRGFHQRQFVFYDNGIAYLL